MVGFNTLFTSSLDKPWGDPLPALERIHRSLRTFLSSNLWRGHREHSRVLVELPRMFRGNIPLCHFHSHCFIRKMVWEFTISLLFYCPKNRWTSIHGFSVWCLDTPSKITSTTGSFFDNPWEGSGCWQLSKKVCLRRPSCRFAYVNVNLWVRIFYSKHV